MTIKNTTGASPRSEAIAHLRAALATGVRGAAKAALQSALDALIEADERGGDITDLHIRRLKPRTRIFDPKRPGLIVRMGADGKKAVWMYRYKRLGTVGQVELRFGIYPEMSLAEARGIWGDLRAMRLRGVEPRLEVAQAEMTVGQLMDLYLTKYVAVAQSAGTRALVNPLLERWMRPHADVAVSSFGPAQARAVLEPLIASGRLVKASQLKTACSTMWMVGLTGGTKRHRVGEPWLDAAVIRNPWPLAIVPAAVSDTYVPRDIGEMRSAVRAIAALGETGDVVWLQALTGVRLNEACGARVSEVDVEGRVWTIPAARMKSNVAHRVMLSDAAFEIVSRRIAMAKVAGRDHLFAMVSDPSRVLTTTAAQKLFAKVIVAGGLNEGFTSHAWRRAIGTWVMENAAPKDIRDRLLAHREGGIDAHYSMAALDTPARKWWARWAAFLTGMQADESDTRMNGILGIETMHVQALNPI
jgi:hypothetical protein